MNSTGKRAVLILAPLLILGLFGGAAWSHRSGEPRDESVRVSRGERGAFHRGYPRHGRGRSVMARMAERLNLDDKQIKEIRHAFTESRKKAIRLRADARVARIELGQLVTATEVDQAKISAKVDEITRLQGELLRERAATAVAIKELLTPEQEEKAEGMIRRLLNRRRGPRGR